MRKFSDALWGLFLIAIAVYLIADKYMTISVSIFTLILTVFFCITTIDGIRSRSIFKTLMSLALIACLYDKELGITAITPWTLLLATALVSWGLEKIFHPRKHKHFIKKDGAYYYTSENGEDAASTETNIVDGNVSIDNNFASTAKYLSGEDVISVDVDNNFGSVNLYFDGANLVNHIAEVSVDNNFGRINLYVPADWFVQVDPDSAFGSVYVKHENPVTYTEKLVIHAETSFGSIGIY
jgi:predicted membrane protein